MFEQSLTKSVCILGPFQCSTGSPSYRQGGQVVHQVLNHQEGPLGGFNRFRTYLCVWDNFEA